MAESTTPDTAATTLVELFLQRVAASGAQEAVAFHSGDEFTGISWQAMAMDVYATAAALVDLGVQPGDNVIQVSENRYEWLVFDLAIQMAAAVHVPVHATLSAAQIAFQIADSDARVIVASTFDHMKSLTPHGDQLPEDATWILVEPPPSDATPLDTSSRLIHCWSDLISPIPEARMDQIQQRAPHHVTADSLATILYTSGTTGDPKGVMLTQANLVFNTLGVLAAMDHEPDDLRITMLPWSHIFARTCDIYTWIASGCRMLIAESREKILDNCKELQPTLLNSVPYFYEKLYGALKQNSAEQTAGSLKNLLGGRIRVCASGGAALPRHIEDLFQQQEVLLLQGYGLTETSPVISLGTPAASRIGTVGRPLSGVEVRVADDGEVLTRGPHLMRGYYKNAQATEEVIQDGWFHTGDLGVLDNDGYLSITGRKKEMIVLSTGKNVAPVNIELRLTSDPLIAQAMVAGDGRSHLTALIVPDPEVLRGEIIRQGISVTNREQALCHPDVVGMYRDAIDRRLADLAPYEQVGRFHLMDRGFTIESGELTPTLKLRRNAILEHCEEAIAGMYAE